MEVFNHLPSSIQNFSHDTKQFRLNVFLTVHHELTIG